jgi:hypothetical protein
MRWAGLNWQRSKQALRCLKPWRSMAKETSLSITYAFRQESYTREETKQMPYVTTVERAGIEKGYRQGETDLLLWQIKNKFGVESAEDLRDRIASADIESLRRWSARSSPLTTRTPTSMVPRPG